MSQENTSTQKGGGGYGETDPEKLRENERKNKSLKPEDREGIGKGVQK